MNVIETEAINTSTSLGKINLVSEQEANLLSGEAGTYRAGYGNHGLSNNGTIVRFNNMEYWEKR